MLLPSKIAHMDEYKKTLNYLNNLDRQSRAKFLGYCGTTEGYVRKICSSRHDAQNRLFFGAVISRKMEEYTSGVISRKGLRPHDWADIWPELSKQDSTAA